MFFVLDKNSGKFHVHHISQFAADILEEVSRFGGVLSLLWHNSNMDDKQFPGVNKLYKELLLSFRNKGFEPVRGIDLISSLDPSVLEEIAPQPEGKQEMA
jgi:hypothetical protein